MIDLLWDYLQPDREYRNRVYTGWGTKTKEGLCACIERIMENRGPKSPSPSLEPSPHA